MCVCDRLSSSLTLPSHLSPFGFHLHTPTSLSRTYTYFYNVCVIKYNAEQTLSDITASEEEDKNLLTVISATYLNLVQFKPLAKRKTFLLQATDKLFIFFIPPPSLLPPGASGFLRGLLEEWSISGIINVACSDCQLL